MDTKAFLSEFQLQNFRLLYKNSADFTESPWFPVLGVLIYRFIFTAYCIGWIIVSGLHPSNGNEKWFIYLTNWSYFFLTLYFACSTIITAVYYRGEWWVGEYDVQDHDALKPKSRSQSSDPRDHSRGRLKSQTSPLDTKQEEPMCWYHEALWVIYDIAANNAVAICIAYWTLAYPAYPESYILNGLDVSTHLLNCLFIVVETFLSSVPVRLLHILYPFLFHIAYVTFLVIYWASDGTNAKGKPYVYGSTDFTNEPASATGFVFGYALLFQTVAHIILFALYQLRCWGSEKLKERQQSQYREEVEEEENEITV